jgi:tetratricopeptide (TPR) repeat protein
MTSAFVGRQQEISILDKVMQDLLAGKGCIVLIAGEAGIGKSELISQFEERVHSKNDEAVIAKKACRVLTGANDDFGPFMDIFYEIFIDPKKNQLRREFLQTILDIAPDIAGLIPVAGQPISSGLTIIRKLIQKWKPERKEEHLQESKNISQGRFCSEYTKTLQKASKERPLVLIIDDMQWIDESSTDLLGSLSEVINDSRILILGTYRPEELVDRAGKDHPLKIALSVYKNMTKIKLSFLGLKDVSDYISEIYSNNDFPQAFVNFIWKRTKGNCLFVVELTRLLQQEEIIKQRQDTTWSLTREIRDIKVEIPENIKNVIERRIENIHDENRQILECASVEGDQFTSNVLSQLMRMDKIDLSRKLRLIGEIYKIIRESREVGTEIGSYEFLHTLIRDTLYHQLSEDERQDLHEKIGGILENKYESDDRVKELASTLAIHFERGGRSEKALKYYRIAAEEAEKANSFVEASRLYENIRNRIATPGERVDILLRMGSIYQILGQVKEARAALDESLELNPNIGDDMIKSYNLTTLGISLFHLGDFDKSISCLEEALEIYEIHKKTLSKEEKEKHGICLNWLGINYRNYRKFEKAMDFHLDALEIAETVGSPRLRAHVIANIGAIHLWKKEFSRVIDFWEQSLKISKDADDLPWVVHYTIDVGYMHFLNGDYPQAIEKLEEGTRIAQESYFEDNIARGLMNQGNVWFAKGDPGKALKCYEEALSIAEKRRVARLIWRLQHNIGNYYRKKSEYDNAYHWYLASIEYLERMLCELESEEAKKGFLEHRLEPFCSMILLTLEKEEQKSQKFSGTFGYDLLAAFFKRRKQGKDLDKEEEENSNYFSGYYILTE